MEQIIKQILKFRNDRDWRKFHTPANLAKSISIEANELLEHFQWLEQDYNKQEVAYELADVLVYCYLLADSLKLDPNKIIKEKLAINAKKYPVKLVKGSSKKYTFYKKK